MKKAISKIKDILFGIFAIIACLILAVVLWLTGDKMDNDYDSWDYYQ